MSKIIIFSGIDGSGKSTQIDNLIEKLKINGKKSFKFWARGGYTPAFLLFKKIIRSLLGRKQIPSGKSMERERILKNRFISTIWITIACFDLILFWCIYLRIKKLFFDFILCDRYLLDTLIDFEINFSQNDFKKNLLWILLIKLLPIPDLALMLDVPFLESQKRLGNKKEPFPDSYKTAKYRYYLYKKYFYFFEYKSFDTLIGKDHIANIIYKEVNKLTKK